MTELTPDMLLTAYANGYFPMALEKDDPELYWFSPEERGVLPLASFNVPRGLKRAMKEHTYQVTVDMAFEQVIRACGTLTPARKETWINEGIVQLYTALYEAGHAHSIEVWRGASPLTHRGRAGVGPLSSAGATNGPHLTSDWKNRYVGIDFSRSEPLQGEELPVALPEDRSDWELVGGLYGVSLGAAFFGESMFSRAPDASKIALVTLVEILREAGYQLLDTQYVNEHLKQFGVEAWSKKRYMTKLEKALSASPNPSTRFSTASVRRGDASSSSLSDA